jgi:hypothetical protein
MATCPNSHKNADDQNFCGEYGARIRTGSESKPIAADAAFRQVAADIDSKLTTFETSQTDTHGVGSARSLRLKSSSQKNPSQYCDTALMRHTFRNECNEANLEPVSDTPTTCPVRFPLQPSCCQTVCTDPYIRLASACLGTQRTGPFRYRTQRATRRSKILCCCGTARNEPPDGIWSSP